MTWPDPGFPRMANLYVSHGMRKVLGHTVNDVQTFLPGKTSRGRQYPGTGFKFILP